MYDIKPFEDTFPGRVRSDERLSDYTTLKIGGQADIFFEAKNTDELVKAVRIAIHTQTPYFILGGGTNLLIADKGIRGIVIRNATTGLRIAGMTGAIKSKQGAQFAYVEAESGVSVNRLVRYTVEEGLSGVEMHLGLPGTVGGAVYMNSKWTKPTGYFGDAVHSAEILKKDGTISIVEPAYFRFAYDYSVLHETRETVIRVTAKLKRSDRDTVWKTANTSIGYRRESQPQGIRSAGCTFQNISLDTAKAFHVPGGITSAGYLIDKAGLKGRRIGGAAVSDRHANFIVNTGTATADDVIQLIDTIKRSVFDTFGIELREEIERIGDFQHG